MELDGAYSGWIIFASVIRLVASVVSIVVHACMIDRHLCILLFSAFASGLRLRMDIWTLVQLAK